jgi:radical SAM superfamily enzyme YgiQ (UPF0313 family)
LSVAYAIFDLFSRGELLMRVLLVSLNNELLPEPAFPLGLAIIAGSLAGTEHEYKLVDLCFSSVEDLCVVNHGFKPDVIGLSLRNVDNVAYPDTLTYIPYYKDVIASLRRDGACPIILGGPGYSLFPEDLLQVLDCDYGIKGSGEKLFPELLRAIAEDTALPDFQNVYQRVGTTCKCGAEKSTVFQSGPDHSQFNLPAYNKAGGMINVQTKRGCAFTCIYCSYPVLEGKIPTTRPIAEVIAELRYHTDRGVDEVYFVDSLFNHPVEYAKELCRALIKADLPLKWTCYAAPYLFDQEMADLCVASGCLGVEFGTDCMSEPMMKNMGKVFSVADVQDASRHCRRAGLAFCHALLLGGPGETWDTVSETVDNTAATEPTSVIFMTGLRIIPGTKLYDISLREGIITSDTNMLEPQFYLSKELTDLTTNVNKLSRIHKTWIFPGHSIRCSTHLADYLRKRGARGPLWLHMAKKNL